jgi:hypothetical protein
MTSNFPLFLGVRRVCFVKKPQYRRIPVLTFLKYRYYTGPGIENSIPNWKHYFYCCGFGTWQKGSNLMINLRPYFCFYATSITYIMLRDLLTQKCGHKKMVTDFGYPRACRFRKHQIENRFQELHLPTFFKTWFSFHKIGKSNLVCARTFGLTSPIVLTGRRACQVHTA